MPQLFHTCNILCFICVIFYILIHIQILVQQIIKKQLKLSNSKGESVGVYEVLQMSLKFNCQWLPCRVHRPPVDVITLLRLHNCKSFAGFLSLRGRAQREIMIWRPREELNCSGIGADNFDKKQILDNKLVMQV